MQPVGIERYGAGQVFRVKGAGRSERRRPRLRKYLAVITVMLMVVPGPLNFAQGLVSAAPVSAQEVPPDSRNETIPPPPLPRSVEQRLSDPGNVTYVASSFSTESPFAPIPVEIDWGTDSTLTVTASYGTFLVSRERPYLVSMHFTGRPVMTIGFFVQAPSGDFLLPNRAENATLLKVTDSGFIASYVLDLGPSYRGTMSVTYNFTTESDKITATFTPLAGRPQAYSILWLGFTDLAYMETLDLADARTPFTRIGEPDFWAFPGARRFTASEGILKETGNPDYNVTLFPSLEAPFKVRMGFGDAPTAYNGTFANAAGSFSFLNLTGNVVGVSFLPGQLEVDPQFIATIGDAALRYSAQRKIVYDGSVYWLFYIDSLGALAYAYSTPSPTLGSGGTYGWKFGGSVPGEGDWSYLRNYMVNGFTVAQYANTVNVLWTSKAYYSAGAWHYEGVVPRTVVMAEGLITYGAGSPSIQWRGNSVDVVVDVKTVYYALNNNPTGVLGENTLTPLTATYTGNGELVLTYVVLTAGYGPSEVGVIGRIVCGDVWCSPSGGEYTEMDLSQLFHYVAGIHAVIPVVFAGTNAVGAILWVTMSDPVSNRLAYFAQWFDGLAAYTCARDLTTDDTAHTFRTYLPASFDPYSQVAVASTSTAAELYVAQTHSTGSSYNIGAFTLNLSVGNWAPLDPGYAPTCDATEDTVVENELGVTAVPEHITASVESDGTSNDLFFSNPYSGATKLFASHVVPQQGAVVSPPTDPLIAWSDHYPGADDLSAVERAGHYVFGTFVVANAGNYDLRVFQWPTPTDYNAGPNDPWVQLPGGPNVAGVNPASGVLSYDVPLASVPVRGGSISLSAAYREPGLFGGPTDYVMKSAAPYMNEFTRYGYIDHDSMFLDLPWFDTHRGLFHLDAVNTFNVIWNRPTAGDGSYWFNNTAGIRFNFEKAIDGPSISYVLHMSGGRAAEFNADGSVHQTWFDPTGENGLTFGYDVNNRLATIQATSGDHPQTGAPYLSIGYDGGPSGLRINTVTEQPAGRTTRVCWPGQAGCSTSHTVDVVGPTGLVTGFTMDSLGRLTEMTTSLGGKTAYTYATAYQWYDDATEDAYIFTSPVSLIVMYNETSPATIAQQIRFDYILQNQGVVQANVATLDRFAVLQGVTEYRFRPTEGATSVRMLDMSGQVLFYDMQTLSGSNMADLSGNLNAATLGTTSSGAGRFGQARYFDGMATAHMTAAASSSLKPSTGLTVGGWFNMKDLNNRWGVSKWKSGTCSATYSSYLLNPAYGATTGKPSFHVCSGTANDYIQATASLPLNTWEFVVAVFRPGNLTLYVGDGTHLALPYTKSTSIMVLNAGSTDPLTVGSESWNGLAPMYGDIDEVHVFNRALSADEVLSLYNNNVVQLGVSQQWWAYDAQPHVVDTFAGYALPGLDAPSSTSSSYVDDWGNTIYTRDAYGHETYASFANTGHQNEFYAPARLDKTTNGLLYMNDFEYGNGTAGMTVSRTPSTSKVFALADYTMAGEVAPALKMWDGGVAGTLDLSHAISSSAMVAGEFNVYYEPTDRDDRFVFYLTTGGTAREGISFNVDGDGAGTHGGLYYLEYETDLHVLRWRQALGVAIVAGSWYHIGFNFTNTEMTILVNGLAVAAFAPYGSSADGFTLRYVSALNAGAPFWVDDLRLTTNASVVINGMPKGSVAEMFAPDGAVLGLVESTGSAVTLPSESSPSEALHVTLGNVIIRVYGVDGTLDYVSPRSDFSGGDVYSYVPASTTHGRFVRTRTGFDYHTTSLILSEPSDLGNFSYIRCEDTGGYLAPDGNGHFTHANGGSCPWDATGNGWSTDWFLPSTGTSQSHFMQARSMLQTEFVATPSWSPSIVADEFLVTYVYSPLGTMGPNVPMGIGLGAGYSNTTFYAAQWGIMAFPPPAANPNSGAPLYSKDMGGYTPFVYAGTGVVQKLIVKTQDLFRTGSPTGNYYGFYYHTTDGTAYFDGTHVGGPETDSVTFVGIPNFHTVALQYASNGTWMSVGDASGGSPTLHLYPKVSAFPVSVRFVVNMSSVIQYVSAPTTVWGGDRFSYNAGSSPSTASGFYDADAVVPAADIHDALLGTWSSVGDCADALLCYDMESYNTDAQTATYDGTSTVSPSLSDLSGHGRTGTLSEALFSKMGASGTALDFTTSTDVITTASGFVFPTSSFTLSFWLRPTVYPASSGRTRILGQRATGPSEAVYCYLETVASGSVVCTLYNTSGFSYSVKSTGANLAAGQWVHIVVTFDGSTLRMFNNGYNSGADPMVKAFSGTPKTPTESFGLGNQAGAGAIFGALDQVLVYAGGKGGAQVSGLYESRLPNAAAGYSHPRADGLPTRTRTILNGVFVEKTFAYDSVGFGLPIAETFNGHTTGVGYSGLYNSAFATQSVRADGYAGYTAYDIRTGDVVSTLDENCRMTRIAYDTLGRPLQSVFYDTESPTTRKLFLDLQTTIVADSAQTWRFKDVACAFANNAITSMGLGADRIVPGPNPLAGTALSFTGSTTEIDAPDIAISNPITLAAWVNRDATQAATGTVVSRTTGTSGYALQVTPGGTVIVTYPSTATGAGTWNHPASNSGTTNNCGTPTDNGDWSSAANAYGNASYATAAPGTNSNKCNEWGGFNLAVPVGATITGVTVQLHYKLSKTGNPPYKLNVGLYSTYGGLKPTVMVDQSQPTVDTLKTIDFSSLASWTPEHFNNNAIKVDVGAVRTTTGGGAPTFSMNSLILIVTWSYPTLQSSAPLPAGTWVHVAATFLTESGKTRMTLYLNGKQDATGLFPGEPGSAGSTSVVIGRYFKGALDEVQVFAADRTSSIRAIMDGTYLKLTSDTTTYDDSVFPSVTQYSADSILRTAFYDMSTLRVGQTNTFEDMSGNGNNAIPHGTVTTVPGKVGPAQRSQNGYLEVPSPRNLPTSQITVTGWISVDVAANWEEVVHECWLCGAGSWAMFVDSNAILYFGFNPYGTTQNIVSSGTALSWGWHFVAGTIDGSTGQVRLYVDNVLKGDWTFDPVTLMTDHYLHVLETPSGGALTADEIQVIPGVLTSGELTDLYNGYSVGAPSFDPTHVSRAYLDGLGRGVRQVTMDLYGRRLTTARTLGWNGQPTVAFMTTGQYSTATYGYAGTVWESKAPQGLARSMTQMFYSTRTVRTVDGDGRVAFTTSDLVGRVVQAGVLNPADRTQNYTQTRYNGLGQTVAVDVYSGGSMVQGTEYLFYNAAGRLVRHLAPDGATSSQTYDNDLRPSASTDAMGRVAVITYVSSGFGDGMGWVSNVALKPNKDSPTSYNTGYTYDVLGNRLTISNGTATITRHYDSRSRMDVESLTVDAQSFTTTYMYDAASHLQGISYPESRGTAAYKYDSLGRPSGVTWNDVSYALLTYDSYGRLDSMQYPESGNYLALYGYDSMDRNDNEQLVRMSTVQYDSGMYGFDPAGYLLQVTGEYVLPGGTARDYTFGYDGDGRLVSATGPFSTKPLVGSEQAAGWVNYSYDSVGNILKRQDSDLGGCTQGCVRWDVSQTTVYAYQPWGLLDYTSVPSWEDFSYNALGSMTSRAATGNTWTYTFDFEQQLVKAARSSPAYNYVYSYDGEGRKVREVDAEGTSTSKYFAYVGSSLLYEKDTTNGKAAGYVYLGGSLLFRIDFDTPATYHYYLTDPMNNVRVIWSYDGGFVAEGRFRYKPFGQQATPNVAPPTRNPSFRFDGMPLSPTTGLIEMGVRQDDPNLGRFISRDPIAMGDYSYAANNPVNFRDPSGMAREARGGATAGGLDAGLFGHLWYVPKPSLPSSYAGPYGVPRADWPEMGVVPRAALASGATYGVSYELGDWSAERVFAPTATTEASGARSPAEAAGVYSRSEGVKSATLDEYLGSIMEKSVHDFGMRGFREGYSNAMKAATPTERYRLMRLYIGDEVGDATRAAALRDPVVMDLVDRGLLRVTGDFEPGPDFYLRDFSHFWDVTTPLRWNAHVEAYAGQYGEPHALVYSGIPNLRLPWLNP